MRGLKARTTERSTRTARKTMFRFFSENGWPQYADQVRSLRNNSTLTGEQKHGAFQRILDRYAAQVTATAPSVSPGAVDVSSTGGPDAGEDCGVRVQNSGTGSGV